VFADRDTRDGAAETSIVEVQVMKLDLHVRYIEQQNVHHLELMSNRRFATPITTTQPICNYDYDWLTPTTKVILGE
jgi:hypothetical protein